MIRRTFDATELNTIINHPAVRPWMGGEGVLDVADALADADNYALVIDGGGFIFIRHEPGIYEGHSQFLPEARRNTRKAMWAAFDYMFTRTDCERVITQVPDNNLPARALGKIAGFREMFRREDTPRGPTSFMALTIEEWAQANESLEVDGAWFHDGIHAAAKEARPDFPDHPEDKAHDRAVGATVRMIKAGNVFKGVNLYNRWARFAGYTSATVISETPPVINVSEPGLACIVGLKDGEMEILLCRSV
jgi:hypothetical protein